jgi:hypothetical protein
MSEPVITHATASVDEIFNIISALEPVLMEATTNRGHAIIACLSIAVSLQNPNVTPEQLHDAVDGASKWICLFLSEQELEGAGIPKEKLN